MISRQLSMTLSFRPALEREDFLISQCNAEAVDVLDKWPDWNAPTMVIYGPKNSGKTHLAHVWQQKSGARFLDIHELTSQKFTPADIQKGQAYIIDQIDEWISSEDNQEALFHFYNAVKNNQAHMLITSEKPLSHSQITLADLRSRLLSCPHIAIHSPDDDLLTGLLIKLCRDRQLTLPPECLHYCVSRMERSFESAQRLILDIDNLSLAEKRRITIPLIKRIFEQHEQEHQTHFEL